MRCDIFLKYSCITNMHAQGVSVKAQSYITHIHCRSMCRRKIRSTEAFWISQNQFLLSCDMAVVEWHRCGVDLVLPYTWLQTRAQIHQIIIVYYTPWSSFLRIICKYMPINMNVRAYAVQCIYWFFLTQIFINAILTCENDVLHYDYGMCTYAPHLDTNRKAAGPYI